MNETCIGESKGKIYTIPEGVYIGIWSGYFCHLYDKNPDEVGNLIAKIFTRISTNIGMKGTVKVKVVVTGIKAKIYNYGKKKKN